jgi:hypothetical protein
MIGWFRKVRQDGIYVPAMDGPLHPNSRLDLATPLANTAGAQDMAAGLGQVFVAVGNQVFVVQNGQMQPFRRFPKPVTALCLSGDAIVVSEAGVGLHWCRKGGDRLTALPQNHAGCITALTKLNDGRIAYCVGSQTNSAYHWRRDLLQRGHSGKVAVIAEGQSPIVQAEGLAWPCGLAELPDSRLLVSEAWAHRLLTLSSADPKPTDVLTDLPGYPGRLAQSPTGNLALAVFAPRRPQFEFVLSETRFRDDMITNLPEEDWIAPSLTRDATRPDQPIMQGEIRQMGVMKPWAPTASYGLVLRLSGALKPLDSWHSRADGHRHGIVAVCWQDARLLALSAATGEILDLGDCR